MAKKKPTEEEQMAELGQLIGARFTPVKDIAKCDDMYRTEELYEMVERHSPGLVPLRLMRRFLKELGYTEFHLDSGFVWLLASKS